jgi:mevalonate kinase
MTAIGTSSGKVILAGEHAVVFGEPALAVGIDRGAQATSRPNFAKRSRLVIPEWQLSVEAGEGGCDLSRAFGNLLDEVRGNVVVPEVDVEARATLPPGAGLGCSAALGVAIARSLVQDETLVAACSMAWERVFHGNPSGIDAAVCMRGGCLRFVKGQAPKQVTLGAPLFLAVGFSGHSSSTRTMVEHVARLRESERFRVDAAFAHIRQIVEGALVAVSDGQVSHLGSLLSENQRVLAALALSTPAIDRLCAIAEGAGALGSKLTGAGGGGCVVALAPNADGAQRVLGAWAKSGFSGFATGAASPTLVQARR